MYWNTSARKTKRTAPISESKKGRVFSPQRIVLDSELIDE